MIHIIKDNKKKYKNKKMILKKLILQLQVQNPLYTAKILFRWI